MQRTNNLTNKHKRCWKRKVDAGVQKKILGLPRDDDSEMFLRFYSRAGVAAATPGAAFACSVIAGRHGDWWVSRIEQRNKQDTGGEREREREKEKSSARKERERESETEGERAREQKGTVPCDGVLAEERQRALYCAGPIPPPPTYSDIRVLENYYLNMSMEVNLRPHF